MKTRILAWLAPMLLVAVVAGAAGAAELEWPSRRWLKSGDTFYYPDGRWMKSGDALYYPDGRWMLSGETLYYPSGRWLVSGDTWYNPDGSWAYKGWIGTLVNLKEGPTTLNVWRETDTSPVRVAITVEHSEYRYEYLAWGDRHGARLWAIGRWIPVMGDQTLFEPPPAKHHGKGGKGGGGGRGHGGGGDGDGDDGDDGHRARDPYRLCGFDFDVDDSIRTESEEVILDRKGELWVVVLETCRGGRIAAGVDDFLVLDNGWTFYLHESGNAWLLANGSYFHVGGDVASIRGGKKNRFETKLSEAGWIKYSAPTLVDGSLRVQDDTAKREIWLAAKETFRWGW